MERAQFIKRLMILSLAPTLFVAACKNEKKSEIVQKYTCPMHPQVIKDAPGTCPICGMDLVPLHSEVHNSELTLSESQIQLANVVTLPVAAGDFSASKVLNARLVPNPASTELISSRYPGRIEKLFVKETGRLVSSGQPLFQIYSEELQTLQQDYLLQIRQAAAFPNEKIYRSLRDAAANKLRLYGYSKAQLARLASSNTTSALVTVNARTSGMVNEVSVSEGQYVAEGSPVMRLENYDQLWVEAEVYPTEAALVKTGTPVQVSVQGFPEMDQTARISFISPQLDPASQILTARAVIRGSGKLQPGMQARVILPTSRSSDAISLPLDAVLRDGKGAHVWVKTGKNTFAPRTVTTGAENADQIIITSGLEGVKEVVVSGAYLLSGEYTLKKGSL